MAELNVPGCYGLPSAISAASESCRSCGAKGHCAKESFSLLEKLPDKALVMREKQALTLTIKGLFERSASAVKGLHYPVIKITRYGLKRVELTPEQEKYLNSLPRKVGEQTRQLMEKGWFDFARQEIKSGNNPALKGWRFIACQKLIENKKTSWSELTEAFVSELGLTLKSAKTQASIGIAIFAAGGLVKEAEGGEILFTELQ